MSLIQILNYSQKKEFETPPLLEYEIRQEIFSVSPIIKQYNTPKCQDNFF